MVKIMSLFQIENLSLSGRSPPVAVLDRNIHRDEHHQDEHAEETSQSTERGDESSEPRCLELET